MKKLKFLVAAAMVAVSGAALAESNQPLYHPASVYNPATGQYESGCGASWYWSYGGYGQTNIPALLDGAQYYVANNVVVSCYGGYLHDSGNAYDGYVGY